MLPGALRVKRRLIFTGRSSFERRFEVMSMPRLISFSQQPSQQSFLSVQAICRLLNYGTLRAIDDFIRDLFTAASRQAMHEFCFLWRQAHQLSIDLKWLECLGARRLFLFLTHTRPNIGVN